MARRLPVMIKKWGAHYNRHLRKGVETVLAFTAPAGRNVALDRDRGLSGRRDRRQFGAMCSAQGRFA